MKTVKSPSISKSRRSAQITILSAENQGGLYVSVNRFREALSQFSEHILVNINYKETLGIPAKDCLQVPIVENKLARAFGYIATPDQCRIKEILKECHFVLIHVPFRFHSHWAARECVKNKVPYVFVAHGAFDPYVFTYRRLRKRIWARLFGDYILRNAYCTIYSSLREQQKAVVEMGAHKSKVFYWPVDLPKYHAKDFAKARIAELFGVPSQKKILLYLGRLHSMKRPLETILAFSKLAPRDWLLVVAGPDDEYSKSELSELSKDNPHIRIIGAVFGEDKQFLLAASDMTILLSKRENFGFAIVESLSFGVPALVSTEVDIAVEISRHNAGVVIDAGSQESVLSGLSTALDLPASTLNSMGARGRLWVENELSIQEFDRNVRSTVEEMWSEKNSTE